MTKSSETKKTKKVGRLAENLQGRLVYMALKCPLVQGGRCAQAKPHKIRRTERSFELDEMVALHVELPYGLRLEAQKAHLNCSALLRGVLRRRLRSLRCE